MTQPTYPSLFQVSTRAWLTELSAGLGRPATLDDIPDAALDRIADDGFDWVWPLGVWQTGAAGREVSRSRPEWRREYQEMLPDLTDADICGSCFAITAYRVHRDLGGNAALRRLRRRLAERGLKLMLDFVPNHTALDHPWIEDHPDFFIAGSEADLARTPENYCRVETSRGPIVLAHGRDPYFPGWPDTLQLDYGNPELQKAMREEILAVADLCDGVRCDMAMLILPEVFQRTWGIAIDSFWPDAIAGARRSSPGFMFMAEVYWDLEWTLMQQGFDYAYDKRLYDRLREQNAGTIRDHLVADLDYQRRLARFLENHDEPRAAAVFPPGVHQAAAVVTFLAPGLRFFHDGQFEGRKKRLPVHLCRRAAEDHRHGPRGVLSPAAGRSPRGDLPQRALAAPFLRPGLARQRKLRRLHRLSLGARRRIEKAGSGQLRAAPGPVPYPAAGPRFQRQGRLARRFAERSPIPAAR